MTQRCLIVHRLGWLGLAFLSVGCAAPDESAPWGGLICRTPDCQQSTVPPNPVGGPAGSAPGAGPAEPSTASDPDSLFQQGQPAAACDASLVGQLGYTPLRRLTQTQYEKTVEDLFMMYGVALGAGAGKGIPGDGLAGAFPSNAAVDVSEQHVRAYETVAQSIAATATADPNFPKLVAQCGPSSADAQCAQLFIGDFASKAFRHPINPDQTSALNAVYQAGASTGFRDGIALVVEAVLQSPEFVYHVESKLSAAVGPEELDPSELAARLSYFLWNSLPDAELTRAAQARELSDASALRERAQQMLADPKGERTVRLFTYHWLSLAQTAVADLKPSAFPEYTGPGFNQAALDETHAFMQYELRGQGPGTLEELFTAAYSFPPPELAAVYGSQPSDGTTPVALPAGQRAGVLTQSAFLLGHSDADFKTSAIKRGSTVVNNFLCYQFRLPTNVDIDLNIPEGAPGMSARDRLEQHTAAAVCQGCHGAFNPVGFTFDRYDALGKIRDVDPYGNRLRDDATLALNDPSVDGPTVGPLELGRKIAGSDRGRTCMVRQMYRHALTRLETGADTCSLVDIAQRFAGSNFDVRQLMLDIVTSDGFRKRSGS